MKKAMVSFLVIVLLIFPYRMVQANVYKVGPGDILEISVWKDDTLSRDLTIPPDGNLSFPLIDDVNVSGLSIAEIRKLIKERLIEYIPDASVTVILKKINCLKAYVIGQVKNPGEFPITLETRVMQILSQAKGLTPFASEKDIHILRYQNNKIEKIGFNYKEVLNGRNLKQDILLKRGDVVVVP